MQILCGAVLAINISFTRSYAAESFSDWRPDYKVMVGAYYTNNYDEAIEDAKTCLDKVVRLTNNTERTVALDELIKYLNMMGGRNGQQQNYAQQEKLLKCKLKANEAKYSENPANNYQTDQVRKDLATCLVLEGKSKEAETYLTKTEKPSKGPELTGWKKDVDLLTQANMNRNRLPINGPIDPDKVCEYATNTVNDILTIKNATEKEVAITQITPQLQTAKYRYKSDKDYPHEEKILKLLVKIQEISDTEDDFSIAPGLGVMGRAYLRISTLQELVTCLVMQNKNDEAADYNKMYKQETEQMAKRQQKLINSVADRTATAIDDKNKSTDKKE